MATEEEILEVYSHPKEQKEYIIVNGVEFLVLVNDNGKRTKHFLRYPDGTINPTELIAVLTEGSYTLAETKDRKRVMVDDKGVHEEW